MDDRREALIIELREFLGTPWHHNQAEKGIACDCVGLLRKGGEKIGLNLPPFPEKYDRLARNGQIRVYLETNFTPISIEQMAKADVVMFQANGFDNHVGVITKPMTVIHASQRTGMVVEHTIDGVWLKMLRRGGVYRWD